MSQVVRAESHGTTAKQFGDERVERCPQAGLLWKTFEASPEVVPLWADVRNISHLQNPADTLRQINALCPLTFGRTIVAAVRLADQVVTGAKVATTTDEQLPVYPDCSELARPIADDLAPERGSMGMDKGGIRQTLVTVVCRDGYVIAGRREFDWLRAWLYSNHFRGTFDGDVYVVTPHGWAGSMDHRAGYEPCLPSSPAQAPPALH